ncbi:SAVED domain-containing protein [Planomicrobium sp. CPCC 101079]|uniref:SAVED domain-containing protein n=1 Tax=Planomicrobium sp. CPCC 101079 TaxID=2599618 RepID=UPI0011B65A43|nr:SAVED domain-containing protein [Planomicrobium sp. CPCC 101079]TWT01856.1 SAVED domain-containing protein [Planomicrobium sp. CPCC 101079]
MSKAIVARMHGDDYQAYFFWSKISEMFQEHNNIEKVGYEYEEIKSIDDVVVFYKNSIMDENGDEVKADYFQVKYHATQNGSFTWAELINPAFINASSVSFLQKIANAQKQVAPTGKGVRFYIVSPWNIHPDDQLSQFVSNVGGQIREDKLFKGGDKSAMGKVRKAWREHLNITDEELKIVLRTLRIKFSHKSIEDMKNDVFQSLYMAGFKPINKETNTNPYIDLIKFAQKTGKTEFTKEAIIKLCEREGLWIGKPLITPKAIPIGIRSFSRNTEYMDNELIHLECLLENFNDRKIKKEYDWDTNIFPKVEKFLHEFTREKSSYHLYLETHSSIAFAAGYLLDSKAGVNVAPVQNYGGRQPWVPNPKVDLSGYTNWDYKVETLDNSAKDIAVVIAVRHDILEEVKFFIDQKQLPIKKIIVMTPGINPGAHIIKDATHAWILADNLATKVNNRALEDRLGKMHIFMSGPNALTFFIGQNARAFGKFTLYEYNFETRIPGDYESSFSFPPGIKEM